METQEQVRLPIAEIDALYPEHWILIDQPEVDALNRVVSGIVMFAHREKKEVHQKAGEFRLTRAALRCTRKEPGRKYVL